MERLAWIGLGANLGDPIAAVRDAIARIGALPGCRLLAQSSLYRSAPVDAGGDDYVNAVLRVCTALEPRALLDSLLEIETAWGRERPFRNAPRTLDLDLLMMQGVEMKTPELTLPHPRMHLRAFVLVPLAEIDADAVIPGHGHLAPLIAVTAAQAIKKIEEPAQPD